ncbi:hypothetical protein [Microbacterium sp. NPDC058389]|uniref:hypothetical protein n=1 Tax=Microbacterium sp. NPDC058389 TaxID=3346475 RepID=UPI003668D52F
MTASTSRWTRSFPDGAYVVVEPGWALAVPGRPAPQHPDAPAVQVTSLGATAVVQAGWCWPIPEAEIRSAVGPVGAAVAVASAITTAPRVELVRHDDLGTTVIAAAAASAYPPYTAVLSATVDTATAAVVARAVSGVPGLVSVVYRAEAADLPLDPDARSRSAAHGVAIAPDRSVTATADVADWSRHDNEQE